MKTKQYTKQQLNKITNTNQTHNNEKLTPKIIKHYTTNTQHK